MKKTLMFFLVVVISALALIGCQTKTYEIALITDKGDIDDKSFNQGSWEGVKAFAEERGISHKYYRPAEVTDDAYLAAIDLAVKGGAKVIVTPGYLFTNAVNQAQKKHPTVKFIILDASPADAEGGTIESNVYSIFYKEEQAGFLAGYAAVHEGFRKLAFLGGMAVPAVKRFGLGFVVGAGFAAEELGIDKIQMEYFHSDGFAATPDIQAKAAGWYAAGTEVIFACGGSIGQSAMAAAEAIEGKKVIGVDVNQKGDSPTVITSAMKGLGASVQYALGKYYDGKWDEIGGTSVSLGIDQDGVGLPDDFERFENFTQAQYNEIVAKLISGEVTIDVVSTQETVEEYIEYVENLHAKVNVIYHE
ncbi:MAG TPA: BMP family ABC transporter substrate-binding protein [Bacilli bacterium]|nr:BMP family ABC transporter substrate-binding protein [Bacilli bacterium]